LSADVYCQNINNPKYTSLSDLYETERRGECAGQQRDRERERGRVHGLPQTEVASIIKMAVGRTDHFGTS